MSRLEFNKIVASIIVAIIIFVLIGFFSNILINEENKEQAKNAYLIEIEETSSVASSTSNDLELEAISAFLANASIESGEKLFKKCSACHTYKKGAADKVGPNLWNLINRPLAKVDGFAYSKALSEFGGAWGYEELSQFLYKPKQYIEGTKMNFSGLKKSTDRADLILFLREQAEDPAPLP